MYMQNNYKFLPDGTSDKTSASGAGGMGFKSRADQISHKLPTTRHRCNLMCGLGAKPRSGHRLPRERDTRKVIKRV